MAINDWDDGKSMPLEDIKKEMDKIRQNTGYIISEGCGSCLPPKCNPGCSFFMRGCATIMGIIAFTERTGAPPHYGQFLDPNKIEKMYSGESRDMIVIKPAFPLYQ